MSLNKNCKVYKKLDDVQKDLIDLIFPDQHDSGDKNKSSISQIFSQKKSGRIDMILLDILKKSHSCNCGMATKMRDEVFKIRPELIIAGCQDKGFEGQTPLHVIICNGDVGVVEQMLKLLKPEWSKQMATGKKFKKSAMMGQLPLSVAALTFNTRECLNC